MKTHKEITNTFLDVKVMPFSEQRLEKNEKEGGNLGAIKSLQKPGRIESLLEKVKNVYISKFEKKMTAITFAETGEFDIAKDILGNEKKDEKT